MRKPNFKPSAGSQSTDQRGTAPLNTAGAMASRPASTSSATAPASHAAVRRRPLSMPASSAAPAKGASANQGRSASLFIGTPGGWIAKLACAIVPGT